MCEMFWCLKELAATHFPKNKEVRYSVISGFIFLRFFAPAILGPRLFDITTEQIVRLILKKKIISIIYNYKLKYIIIYFRILRLIEL